MTDFGDIVMLVIESWWQSLDVGDIFWMLMPDANVKR